MRFNKKTSKHRAMDIIALIFEKPNTSIGICGNIMAGHTIGGDLSIRVFVELIAVELSVQLFGDHAPGLYFSFVLFGFKFIDFEWYDTRHLKEWDS